MGPALEEDAQDFLRIQSLVDSYSFNKTLQLGLKVVACLVQIVGPQLHLAM